MQIRTFKDLMVWQKSYQLALDIYKISKNFPSEEKFGLTSQIRRAAISVPSNIAEGYARRYIKSYISFLKISHGSIAEVETQILISKDLGYTKEETLKKIIIKCTEIQKMLWALIRSLEKYI